MLKDLCYSTNESLFYTYLLNENGFNTVNDSISGANVVKLFLKSKLDKFALKKIWDLASERKLFHQNKILSNYIIHGKEGSFLLPPERLPHQDEYISALLQGFHVPKSVL